MSIRGGFPRVRFTSVLLRLDRSQRPWFFPVGVADLSAAARRGIHLARGCARSMKEG